MIYRSNLVAPDLTSYFPFLHSRVMGHSFGHDVLSDWADKADDDPVFGEYKQCGLWTHDEAAILSNIAPQVQGDWLDIGAHTGWTAAHIAESCGPVTVTLVDPILKYQVFQDRMEANLRNVWDVLNAIHGITSEQFFARSTFKHWHGIVIDGDHHPGEPLKDAKGAIRFLKPDGVILFHDFVGLPVQEAVRWLMDEHGMSVRLYLTPHVVACCWRGKFIPPKHEPDPALVALQLWKRWPEMDWEPYFNL